MAGFAPGDVLDGKYRLIAPLGSGGMGTVWRAEHLTLRSGVAVKVMNQRIADHPDALARFQREAQAAAALRSPHVVSVLDSGVHDGAPFVVMELLEGESLDQRLRRVGRLPFEETARIVTQVARALTRAHEAGIVHRDLKPANVFLQHNADEELAKVLDFGVAKLASMETNPLTSTGAVLGSPHYMSPEQARGRRDVDRRSDVWALGIIAFECTTGRRPFESAVLGDLLLKICTDPAPPPSTLASVPAGFDAWFARAIERDPDRRFQTALELSDALSALVPAPAPAQSVSVAGAGAPLAPPLVAQRSSSSSIALLLGLATLGIALVVVLVAGVAVVMFGLGASTETASTASSPSAVATSPAIEPPIPSASAEPAAPKPARGPAPTASKAAAATTATGAPPAGPNACVQACNRVRACAPGTHCDSSGACTGWKLTLANCINGAGSCQQAAKCL
jgi:serine/threonine-protein kinase